MTLILLAISAPFMTSTSAFRIVALPPAAVYMDPFKVDGVAGEYVTVYMKISDITNLFSFQAGLLFNPTTVEIANQNVTEGGFLSNNGADTLLAAPGTVDNVNGIVNPYGWTLTDVLLAKNGNGNLMKFVFHMKVTGYSDIHINAWQPLDQPALNEIPTKTIDYFTANAYTVKIVGNPQGTNNGNNGFSDHAFSNINILHNSLTYTGQVGFNITASGANGDTFAFFNITVPNGLMSCDSPNDWWVELDGVDQGGRIITSNSTHTTISLEFTYGAALINVEIRSVHAVPEFSAIFFATLLILATFAAALFGKATWSSKRKV